MNGGGYIDSVELLNKSKDIYLNKELPGFSKQITGIYDKLRNKIHDNPNLIQLDPIFSFVVTNFYILSESYPEKQVSTILDITFATLGRAIRNILVNSLNIVDLKAIEDLLKYISAEYHDMVLPPKSDISLTLIPHKIKSEENRKLIYRGLGILFTSFDLQKEPPTPKNNYVYHLILEQILQDTECLKKQVQTIPVTDIYSKVVLGNSPLLKYVMLLMNDALNSTIDTSFKFINYRLLSHHMLRDLIYSLYARFIIDDVIDTFKDYYDQRMFYFDVTQVEENREIMTGLSGNFRIIDDIVLNLFDFSSEMREPTNLVMKIINLGIKSEEIFNSWREIRNDLGIYKWPSLLFIPMYPEQNLYGEFQKFKTLRPSYDEGNIALWTLPELYEGIKLLIYHHDDYESREILMRFILNQVWG